MANKYNISIIVPVYNGEKSLKRLLGQLSRQTYHGNIEFIIVPLEPASKWIAPPIAPFGNSPPELP